jgi:hypothetical protein
MFVDMNQINSTQNGLTVPAAAARAGVDQLTIREAINRGELIARQRLVLTPADVDRWADQQGMGERA